MAHALVVISDNIYAQKIYDVVKDFEQFSTRVLYISLNKTYKILETQFQRSNIPLDKFYFIDTISASLVLPEQRSNCLFLPSADDLTLLYTEINKRLSSFDLVIFDSLSSLAAYSNTQVISQFTATLLDLFSRAGISSLFTCLHVDEHAAVVQHIKPKLSNVIYMLS